MIFLWIDDAPRADFPQAASSRAGALLAEVKMLSLDAR
jgi:hypothetical protein